MTNNEIRYVSRLVNELDLLKGNIKKLEEYLEIAYKGQEDFKRIIKDKEKLINDLDAIIKEYEEELNACNIEREDYIKYSKELEDDIKTLENHIIKLEGE